MRISTEKRIQYLTELIEVIQDMNSDKNPLPIHVELTIKHLKERIKFFQLKEIELV